MTSLLERTLEISLGSFLREIQVRRGITDFLVVCDETNNTGDVIDRNEFKAEIFIKPARSINFITLQLLQPELAFLLTKWTGYR